jgi:hypothetical protein
MAARMFPASHTIWQTPLFQNEMSALARADEANLEETSEDEKEQGQRRSLEEEEEEETELQKVVGISNGQFRAHAWDACVESTDHFVIGSNIWIEPSECARRGVEIL